MRATVSRMLLWAALAAAPIRVAAQEILLRAMDLEEAGAWTEARALYRQVLAGEPTNAAALLGLERVSVQPAQRDTVLAFAERAVAADPAAETGYAIELRVLRAMGRDSLALATLERWVAVDSASASPYREWARVSFKDGRMPDARDAVLLARRRLRNPSVLAPEMAQIDVAQGDWAAAAAEWRGAVEAQPAYLEAASFSLRPAPAASRDAVIRALGAPDGRRPAHETSDAPPARSGPDASATAPEDGRGAAGGALARTGRQVAASLLLGWNEPGRAWSLLKDALPAADSERVTTLRTFAERASALDGPGAQRAAAGAYELLAAAGPAEDAASVLIESARAYAAAGDTASARRVLRGLAADASASGDIRRATASAMIDLLVREDNPQAAERALAAAGTALPGSERDRLGRAIARGWLRLGAPDRAAHAVAGDSSLAGDEVRGWIELSRGNLADARRLLREAGALVGDRAEAPARAEAVALIDAVGRDTLPALGAALLLAERGDSLRASRALVAVARGLPDSGASPEAEPALLSWAARLAAAGGDSTGAETLWQEVARRFGASNAAPTAELQLARLLAGRGDFKGAAARLEAMILAHPDNALVPEARRELDRVRGQVPGS